MKEKTQPIKVTLRPKQIDKIKDIAKVSYDGNFSFALRIIIDKHKIES
jgi:hypothetical protein